MDSDSNSESKLEVSIGFSRKWDAREAGREVARITIKKLNQPPTFFLLFSTIHYKDHGGFQELLNGVWDVLPKGTPLIGGTVAGFINNYGCYARGATALAISYPNMDVAVGLGRYTKLNPKSAGAKCAKMIKEKLNKSKYNKKFFINVISGPKLPKLPRVGPVNIIESKFFGYFFSRIGLRIFPYFGYSIGKEEDVLYRMSKLMPDYYFIGCTSADDGRFLADCQFSGENVFSNSIVALGFSLDLPMKIDSIIGLHQTNKKFKITKTSFGGRLITKIEHKPAKDYLYRYALNLSEEQIKKIGAFYYKLSYHFPMTFEEDTNNTSGVGAVIGQDLLLGHKVKGKHVILLSVTGKEAINNIEKLLPRDTSNISFMFMFSSAIYNFILGDKTFDIKEKLDEKLQEIPYLMVQPMIENIKHPNHDPYIRVYSLNTLSLRYEEDKEMNVENIELKMN
jgi:hypothetical protein